MDIARFVVDLFAHDLDPRVDPYGLGGLVCAGVDELRVAKCLVTPGDIFQGALESGNFQVVWISTVEQDVLAGFVDEVLFE